MRKSALMAVFGQAGLGNGVSSRLPVAWEHVRTWLADGSDNSRAQRAAGSAFLIRVASAAVAFLSQPLLARWMGSYEFGIYAYVWTWLTLLGGVIDCGLGTSAQRFIPEYAERKSLELLRGFLSGTRWLAVGLSSLAAVVGVIAIKVFETRLDHFLVLPMYLACLTLPLLGLAAVQDGIARSFNWIGVALLPIYIVRPLAILLLMLAAYLAGFHASAVIAMTAVVLATWATAIFQLAVLDRSLRGKIAPGAKSYAFGTWFATSLPITVSAGFYFLLSYVDVLVVEVFRSPQDVAVYFAAQKMLALVAFVYFSVSATVAYKFAEYQAAGDRARLAGFFARSINWTFWPSLAGVIVLLVLGHPLLWLFGPEFVQGYPLIGILAVGLLARAAVGPADRLLTMLGRQKLSALVYGAAFACNLLACVTLIPRFGLAGAALSTTAALLVESGALFWLVKRELGMGVFMWGGRRET